MLPLSHPLVPLICDMDFISKQMERLIQRVLNPPASGHKISLISEAKRRTDQSSQGFTANAVRGITRGSPTQ